MRVEWLSNAAVLLLWAPLLFLCLGLIVSVCLPWPLSEATRVVTGMSGLSYYYIVVRDIDVREQDLLDFEAGDGA